MKKGMNKATGPVERVVHWCVALSCLLLCITGMGMMYNSLNFIGTLVGGMGNLKLVHNFGGIFFSISLVFTILMWWKEAGVFSFPEDAKWIKAAGGYLWHVENVPEVGKYNPGQKMFFLAVALFGAGMVVSGFIMWFPLGFSVKLVRLMYVLHALGLELFLRSFLSISTW
jgi:formate dehydrogenase subunit gamma